MPATRLAKLLPKSQPSKLKSLWLKSETKIWAYTQAGAAMMIGVFSSANHFFQSEQFQNLEDKISLPHWVPLALAVLALITYVAHGHGEDV